MAVASANRTVVGVFESMDDAQRAFDALVSHDFSRDQISFVANKTAADSWGGDDARPAEGTASNVAADAGIGAALGGVGGLLLSLAGLAIPGIGPVLAAGPIIAALGGAGIGAAAGGLIGALTDSGVPESEANYYAEGVRRGDILITVRAEGDRAERAAEIMDDNGAVDIDRRVSDWRERGWTSHDLSAPPLESGQIRRERQAYRPSSSSGLSTAGSDRRTSRNTDPAGVQHGLAGVSTGTGPSPFLGTESGQGTGAGIGRAGDSGQKRGMMPGASPLTGSEAEKARRAAERTSSEAADELGTPRRDVSVDPDRLATREQIEERRKDRRRAARIFDVP